MATVFIHGAQSLLGLLGFCSSLCAFVPVGSRSESSQTPALPVGPPQEDLNGVRWRGQGTREAQPLRRSTVARSSMVDVRPSERVFRLVARVVRPLAGVLQACVRA